MVKLANVRATLNVYVRVYGPSVRQPEPAEGDTDEVEPGRAIGGKDTVVVPVLDVCGESKMARMVYEAGPLEVNDKYRSSALLRHGM